MVGQAKSANPRSRERKIYRRFMKGGLWIYELTYEVQKPVFYIYLPWLVEASDPQR